MFAAIELFFQQFLGPQPHNFLGNILAGAALIFPFLVVAFLFSFPFAAFGGVLFVAGFMADGQNWSRRLVPLISAIALGTLFALIV